MTNKTRMEQRLNNNRGEILGFTTIPLKIVLECINDITRPTQKHWNKHRPTVDSSLRQNAESRTSKDLLYFVIRLIYLSDRKLKQIYFRHNTHRVRRLARPLNTPSPKWLMEFSPRLRLSRKPNPRKAVSSSLVRWLNDKSLQQTTTNMVKIRSNHLFIWCQCCMLMKLYRQELTLPLPAWVSAWLQLLLEPNTNQSYCSLGAVKAAQGLHLHCMCSYVSNVSVPRQRKG